MTELVRVPVTLQEAPGLGAEAEAWLAALPELVASCAASWDLELGYAPEGWPNGLWVRCRRRGRPVSLVLYPSSERFAVQARILTAAYGRGYPLLYEADADRRALLVEAVGPAVVSPDVLASVGAAHDQLLAETLNQAWAVPVAAAGEPGVADHPAAVLRDRIVAGAATLKADAGQETAISRALAYVEHRLADDDPDRHVLVHGAAHAAAHRLAAARPGAESGAVLLEPKGLRCEREYDLGMILSEANRWLLAADDPVVTARDRCAHLARAAGADAEVVWQWSVIQRIARGMELRENSAGMAGRLYLQAARALVLRVRG